MFASAAGKFGNAAHTAAPGLDCNSPYSSVRSNGILAEIETSEHANVAKGIPSKVGDHVSGRLTGAASLVSGRLAMIEDGLGFQLVRARPDNAKDLAARNAARACSRARTLPPAESIKMYY